MSITTEQIKKAVEKAVRLFPHNSEKAVSTVLRNIIKIAPKMENATKEEFFKIKEVMEFLVDRYTEKHFLDQEDMDFKEHEHFISYEDQKKMAKEMGISIEENPNFNSKIEVFKGFSEI